MRVLLIRPPIISTSIDYPYGPRFGIPVSLVYLSAVLEKEQIDVIIYDALIDFDWQHLKRNNDGYYHIGAPWDVFAGKVLEYHPHIVGITNPFSDFVDYAIQAASEIKKADKNIIIVIGGPHASGAPQSFFNTEPSVDYVVRGEGERTFIELIRALEKNLPVEHIKGITYLKDGRILSNPASAFIENLDDLPQPAYHSVQMEKYFEIVKAGFPSRITFKYDGSEREASIITSRGCPYQCIFCGNYLHMGRRWRFHSVSYIINHMELLINNYGVKHFHIEDDNLSLNKERFESLLDAIISKQWHITWDTPNGIRAEGLNTRTLEKVKASGCTYLIIGVESGAQQVLDEIIKKKLQLTEVINTAAACKKINLDLHAFYIIGFPGESCRQMKETLQFALQLLWRYDVIPHLGLARPLPATELYRLCEEKGFLTEPIVPEVSRDFKAEYFKRVMIQTPDFTLHDLERLASRFERKVVRVIACKTALWLLFHPKALLRVFKYLQKNGGKNSFANFKGLFFDKLFFKNNLLRGDKG